MNENTLTDKEIALSIATSSRASCAYFTSASMLNASKDYKFANTGGVNSCSSSQRAPEAGNQHMRCEFPTRQNTCVIYYPDFTILKKSVSENSTAFYLSRFKTKTSSYSYKIYDQFSNVYNTFNYVDLELANILTKKPYGDPDSVQEKIKQSYENAIYNGLGQGSLLDHHKTQVMNGFINLYNDKCGRLALPPADYVWKV
jgi:hypothetical protein